MKTKKTILLSLIGLGFVLMSLSVLFLNKDKLVNENKLELVSGTSEKTASTEDHSLNDYKLLFPEKKIESTLIAYQESYRYVAKKVLNSIVNVDTKVKEEINTRSFNFFSSPFSPFEEKGRNSSSNKNKKNYYLAHGLGSGIIFRQEKSTVYVLTNYHVIEDADSISITLKSGETSKARVVGTDPKRDIAVIAFNSKKILPILNFATDDVYPGDIVFAFGSPFGLTSSITQGIVSATGRNLESPNSSPFTSYIQTDAAINKGNSGGALVNIKGELIGMNALIYSGNGNNIGIGFAIPVTTLESVVDDLIKYGTVKYGWLGVNMLLLNDTLSKSLSLKKETQGVFVVSIIKNSPASKDGMLPGDIITSINGQEITSTRSISRKVAALLAGKTYDFGVIRNGKNINLKIKILERTKELELADNFPGFSILEADDELIRNMNRVYKKEVEKGAVLISSIIKESSAAISGIELYDQILEVNGKKINSFKDFYASLSEDKKEFKIRVKKLGINRELTIVIKK